MENHPVKLLISVLLGLLGGTITLMHIGPFSPSLSDVLLFMVACAKALIFGGLGWLGTTWSSDISKWFKSKHKK